MRWNLFAICPPLLSQYSTTADHEAFVERWRQANEAISHMARAYPLNVVADSRLATTRFDASHVSRIDCFHPSVAGQNLFAEKTWQLVVEAP